MPRAYLLCSTYVEVTKLSPQFHYSLLKSEVGPNFDFASPHVVVHVLLNFNRATKSIMERVNPSSLAYHIPTLCLLYHIHIKQPLGSCLTPMTKPSTGSLDRGLSTMSFIHMNRIRNISPIEEYSLYHI